MTRQTGIRPSQKKKDPEADKEDTDTQTNSHRSDTNTQTQTYDLYIALYKLVYLCHQTGQGRD